MQFWPLTTEGSTSLWINRSIYGYGLRWFFGQGCNLYWCVLTYLMLKRPSLDLMTPVRSQHNGNSKKWSWPSRPLDLWPHWQWPHARVSCLRAEWISVVVFQRSRVVFSLWFSVCVCFCSNFSHYRSRFSMPGHTENLWYRYERWYSRLFCFVFSLWKLVYATGLKTISQFWLFYHNSVKKTQNCEI